MKENQNLKDAHKAAWDNAKNHWKETDDIWSEVKQAFKRRKVAGSSNAIKDVDDEISKALGRKNFAEKKFFKTHDNYDYKAGIIEANNSTAIADDLNLVGKELAKKIDEDPSFPRNPRKVNANEVASPATIESKTENETGNEGFNIGLAILIQQLTGISLKQNFAAFIHDASQKLREESVQPPKKIGVIEAKQYSLRQDKA